jgi:hypothetical protein
MDLDHYAHVGHTGEHGKFLELKLIWFLALRLVPDVIVSGVIMYATNSGVFGWVFAFVVLQCVYLLVWLKNSLWSWLMFWLCERSRMSRDIQVFLARNRFPAPPRDVRDGLSYLEGVVVNRELECEMRLKAAYQFVSGMTLKHLGYYQHGMQIDLAFTRGVRQYAGSLPPREKDDDSARAPCPR